MNGEVFRAVCNSALALLLLTTLLWGGCVSCEQFFMFPGTKSHCCNKAGQCERPGKSQGKTDCNRMQLAQQSAAHLDIAPPVLSAGLVAPPAQPPVRFRAAVADTLREHSPPDLQVLNSTFLI